MANLRATYSVVLRSGIPPPDREVLEAFACKVESASGGLLHFMCTAVDLSHPYYIKMETFRPDEEATHLVGYKTSHSTRGLSCAGPMNTPIVQ